jgi:hypothetical protein
MDARQDTKAQVQEHEMAEEKAVGKVVQVNAASVALAEAVAKQKPNIWSKNMFHLYAIMGVGYLVSTMNGFGGYSNVETI